MPITVQFATNRVLTGPADKVGSYRNQAVPPSDPTQITYGTAFVNEVNLTADTVGAITSISGISKGRFSTGAAGDLANAGRNLLIFVHGFDNSFEDAITRAAYNREWLAASGLAGLDTSVVAFSWPSEGQLIDGLDLEHAYKSDQVMAGASGLALMSFLANLEPIVTRARRSGRRVFLLAHSMGHWALQSAVENWFSHGNGDDLLFDEAVLCAGDEQFNTFGFPRLGRLSGLSRLARHITVLFSGADQILLLSSHVNGIDRLGQDGPEHRHDPAQFPPDRFTMADCTTFRDFDFGFGNSHQYYRQSPSARGLIAAAFARSPSPRPSPGGRGR